MREFDTGATRDDDVNKLDFEGFLSPWVLECYANYLHGHQVQSDGRWRGSDNWQKGIPLGVYMKSAWRHFFYWWKGWRRGNVDTDNICALLFNVMGFLHEHLKKQSPCGRSPSPEQKYKGLNSEGVWLVGEDGQVYIRRAT